jgi:hypothetical protein
MSETQERSQRDIWEDINRNLIQLIKLQQTTNQLLERIYQKQPDLVRVNNYSHGIHVITSKSY